MNPNLRSFELQQIFPHIFHSNTGVELGQTFLLEICKQNYSVHKLSKFLGLPLSLLKKFKIQ